MTLRLLTFFVYCGWLFMIYVCALISVVCPPMWHLAPCYCVYWAGNCVIL